jgi:hypothetical protein
MTTKLTLTVEKRVIQRAQSYARQQRKSLSEIVTTYLDHRSAAADIGTEIDPEVLAASDRIPVERVPDLTDVKYRYLKDKHIHGERAYGLRRRA